MNSNIGLEKRRMNNIHIGWLIGVSVLLGICSFSLWISMKLNYEFIEKKMESDTRNYWMERRFELLGRLFKGHILLTRETNVFIPDCFLIQSDDYDFTCTEIKNGIDIVLTESKVNDNRTKSS